jgi:23S rRNA (cytosine1962-C5)-methyltransferase
MGQDNEAIGKREERGKSSERFTIEMAEVTVSRRGVEAVRRGHPWIYRSAVVQQSTSPSSVPGALTRILDESGATIGTGVLDPISPIAVRVWSHGDKLDGATFRRRLERALEVRRVLFEETQTNAYRLLHGEGDRTPGVVVDRYGHVAVLRIDGDAMRAVAPVLLVDLEAVLRAAGITTLLDIVSARGEKKEVVARFGPLVERIEAFEHGVPFVVDLVRGQKTGAFLDQRENRARVGALVARRLRAKRAARVLNLFSYTGGFSLRAALAGGTVTSVDVATAAHATAQESFKLAGVDPRAHAFVAADAFAWLDTARKRGERWDVVISDPPSFAPSEKAKPKALSAYRALHRACAAVLADGGTFVAASCSSHITAEEFLSTLDDAALAGARELRLLELTGPPPDHPTLAAFPEGRYLKCAFLE